MSPITVQHYLFVVCNFVKYLHVNREIDFKDLNIDEVSQFIHHCGKTAGPGRLTVVVAALRSFLRYLYQCGHIATNIGCAIPSVPNWRLASLPKALDAGQVDAILDSCDHTTAVGRRDFAILLLLAQLGLRACEVVRLTLDDIDWTRGTVTVISKGNRCDELPLPVEAGEAMAAYLLNDRPRSCATRRVFVSTRAPFRHFASSTTICAIVRCAMMRSGVVTTGHGAAHRLRHTLAVQMLRNGAQLEEIGQILRHNHPDSTRIYAKVDLDRLRALAPPWPGGVR